MDMSLASIKARMSQHPIEFVYVKDKNSHYIEANDFFLSFNGLSHGAQIREKTDYDLPCSEFADRYIHDDRIAMTTGDLRTFEPTRGIDGQVVLLLSLKYPFLDPDTQQEGIIGFSKIIHDRSLHTLLPVLNAAEKQQLKISDALFGTTVNQHTLAPLTERELDVLYYLLHGLSYKKIAEQLNLSVRTIEDYIEHIKYKCQCNSKYALFDFAIHHGLMSIIPKHMLHCRAHVE
jgi:DNA-binding CsgD family transcriptional regulator